MKKQEWTAGLDHIDPALVVEYVKQKETLTKKRKKRDLWLRAGALAACFVLILSAVIVGPMLRGDGPDVILPPDNGPIGPGTALPPEADQFVPIVNPQMPSPAPQYYGIDSSNAGSELQAMPRTDGISVTAKFLEVLPDTYTFFDSWNQDEFRLIRMKTVKLLKAKEMTDEFYYIVPVGFVTDFSLFDSFVIKDMAQFTYDYSVLYNKTQGKAEQMSLVIFGWSSIGYQLIGPNFMAFDQEGKFDGRLWSATEDWEKCTNHGRPENTLNEAEENATRDSKLCVRLLKDITGDAEQALTRLKTFDYGMYIQDLSSTLLYGWDEVRFLARRYVNGFVTNEHISIRGDKDTDSVAYSEARFNEQDLATLPDLTSALSSLVDALENHSILPPNFNVHVEVQNKTTGLFGWYAKTENGVIGVLRVTWSIFTKDHKYYYDDAYFIVEFGSSECRQISRDDLLELLGEYEKDYIYTGEYYEYGKDFRDQPTV
jgi:hypothetical protein